MRGVLLASAGLVFLQLAVLVLYRMGVLTIDISRWATAFAITVVVQTALWLIPHFGWDARLRWDKRYVYVPTAAAAGLLTLYAFMTPEARDFFLMAWMAALLFVAGRMGFWGVIVLGSLAGAGYAAALVHYASALEINLPAMNIALTAVFLLVNAFAAVVFERLRRQRDERVALQRERRKAEEAAHASAARYQGLFEGIPIGLYATTPTGEFIAANSALAQILGYPSREVLMATKVPAVYADADGRQRWLDLMEREGVVRDVELKLRRKDGQVVWVRDNARAVRDDEDRVISFEGSLEDVTARREAEEALRQANNKLKVWVGDLERRTTEIAVLGKMVSSCRPAPTWPRPIRSSPILRRSCSQVNWARCVCRARHATLSRWWPPGAKGLQRSGSSRRTTAGR